MQRPVELPQNSDPAAPASRVRLALPTVLSLLRIPLACIFPFTEGVGAIVVVLAAAATDGLDGFLARRWRATTAVGSMIDGATDKIFAWTALGTLVVRGELELWMLLLLLVRDAVVVPAAIVAISTKNVRLLDKLDHPLSSRLATLALFVLLVFVLALPDKSPLVLALVGAAIVLNIAAAATYLAQIRRFACARP